jgi:hypothetical protein
VAGTAQLENVIFIRDEADGQGRCYWDAADVLVPCISGKLTRLVLIDAEHERMAEWDLRHLPPFSRDDLIIKWEPDGMVGSANYLPWKPLPWNQS